MRRLDFAGIVRFQIPDFVGAWLGFGRRGDRRVQLTQEETKKRRTLAKALHYSLADKPAVAKTPTQYLPFRG